MATAGKLDGVSLWDPFGSVLRLLTLALAIATGPLQAHADGPEIGKAAPSLTVAGVDGHVLDLEAMRGTAVLVTFWATWCAPCLAEMPVLETFYRTHKADGFEVIALSIDKPADKAKAERLLRKVSYPGALAGEASRNELGTPKDVPVSYLIDKSGVVRDTFVALDADLLRGVVLPVVKESIRP